MTSNKFRQEVFRNEMAMKNVKRNKTEIILFVDYKLWLIILHNGMQKNFRNLFAVLIFSFFCIKTKEQ
jgi:hypothetical protein